MIKRLHGIGGHRGGGRNFGGIGLKKWFKNKIWYTMIASFNIDGFVKSCVGIYPRNELFDKGAAGTVDGDTFRKWPKEKILPLLGDYQKGVKNSIVMGRWSGHIEWVTPCVDPSSKFKILKSKSFLKFVSPFLLLSQHIQK